MSAITYLDVNYTGDSHTFNSGNYDRSYLRDIPYGNFEGGISSIKIDRNTIVLLSNNSSPTGSGNNRVLIGPQNIADLSTIGFNDKINSIKVKRFRETNWGAGATASIFSNYNFTGNYKNLHAGDYDATRIASKENNHSGIADGDVRSLTVGSSTVAILYDGPNFETADNSVYIEGPAQVGDLAKYNLDGKLSSIKIFSIDDIPPNLPENSPQWGPAVPSANYSAWYSKQWNSMNMHNSTRLVNSMLGAYGSDYTDPRQVTEQNPNPPMSIDALSAPFIPSSALNGYITSVKVHESWSDRTTLGIKNGLLVLLFMLVIIVAVLSSMTYAYIHQMRKNKSILEKI